MQFSRREFLQTASFASLSAGLWSSSARADEVNHVPVRVVTKGPKHHWFGYYDKLEFDPSQRFLLGMKVDFEHRSPTPQDTIKLGMVDLEDNDKWIELAETTAWGWQQGCMLQWVPGSKNQIIFNAREKDRYVSQILDMDSQERTTLPSPIYSVSPKGNFAVTADFRRINDVRPGYGYVGLSDPYADDLAPEETGLFRTHLPEGFTELIISLKQIAELGEIPDQEPGIKHYFNHLLFSPNGERFIFLHRWRYPNGSRKTRMLTSDLYGKDIRIIDDNGLTSHFIWRDPNHILAWSRQKSDGAAFYLFEDREGGSIDVVGKDTMPRDGHCTYLPNRDWIVNDTYPDKNREQSVYLFHVPTGKRIEVGRFPSPKTYTGEWRCDTHPRHSPDGKMLVIDAPALGQGRQLHLLDISGIVG